MDNLDPGVMLAELAAQEEMVTRDNVALQEALVELDLQDYVDLQVCEKKDCD